MKRAVAGARVALLPGGRVVVNPSSEEMAASRLDLVVAGTAEAVLMIEGFADFLSEAEMLEVRVGGCWVVCGWVVCACLFVCRPTWSPGFYYNLFSFIAGCR